MKSLSAHAFEPRSLTASSAGSSRADQSPAATRSSARARSSPGVAVSAPRLPHATPSTGVPVVAAARRAVRTVPSPPSATARSHGPLSPSAATCRSPGGSSSWTTSTSCASAQSRSVRRASSSGRLGWMTSARRCTQPARLSLFEEREVDVVSNAEIPIGIRLEHFQEGAPDMALTIGDTAPDFEAQTTEGPIKFHEWAGDSWVVLFSHPRDFTPVCTTELGYMASIKPDFDKRNVKIIGLSVDPVDNHAKWAADIEETQGTAPNYPMIGDSDFNVSKLYGMLPADVSGDPTERTPADNQTVRNVFVIGPDKKIKLVLVYPMTTGRNFDEVLRVVDSLQLTAKNKVATPAQWQQGDDVIIAGSVNDEQAKEIFGEWESPKPYIRIVPQPNGN